MNLRSILWLLAAAALAVLPATAQNKSKKKSKKNVTELLTPQDSAAYALGVANGKAMIDGLKSFPGDSLNPQLMLLGLEDAVAGTERIANQEAQNFLRSYFTVAQEQENQKNKQASLDFLEQNKTKPGVQTTASGLQYQILTQGEGPKPTVEDTVLVHYTGKTINGEVFDSSVERGEPIKFGLLQVIPGWTEGLCLLNEGSKALLFVPQELAYGERGVSPKIPPYSTLIFEVELLQVIKGKPIPVAQELQVAQPEETGKAGKRGEQKAAPTPKAKEAGK